MDTNRTLRTQTVIAFAGIIGLSMYLAGVGTIILLGNALGWFA